jgi:hypothetical protein
MDLKGIEWENVVWIDLTVGRILWRAAVKTTTNFRDFIKGDNFLPSWASISFLGRTMLHRMSSTLCFCGLVADVGPLLPNITRCNA